MSLTNAAIKNAKPRDKDYKLYDEKGLFLLVKENGSKYWRFKYRFGGKEKMLALGVYGTTRNDVSLSRARASRDAAKQLLANQSDPSIERKRQKLACRINSHNTFEEVAADWHKIKSRKWSAGHAVDVASSLEKDIYPGIGKLPIVEIDTLLLRPLIDCDFNRSMQHIG